MSKRNRNRKTETQRENNRCKACRVGLGVLFCSEAPSYTEGWSLWRWRGVHMSRIPYFCATWKQALKGGVGETHQSWWISNSHICILDIFIPLQCVLRVIRKLWFYSSYNHLKQHLCKVINDSYFFTNLSLSGPHIPSASTSLLGYLPMSLRLPSSSLVLLDPDMRPMQRSPNDWLQKKNATMPPS